MSSTTTVPKKNISNWFKSGSAVTATSASDVARQAGLDWSVSLHDLTASYQVPGAGTPVQIPIKKKFGVIKTTPFGDVMGIGVVGNRYQVFQNAEIFSCLDVLIDSGEARYAAAGEYDDGAKVWMLLQLPQEITVADDPHAAFILARTSHDGSSSVIIKPIIERLYCSNQINKIYNNKNAFTYTLKHTSGNKLEPAHIGDILKLSYQHIAEYTAVANKLMRVQVKRDAAVAYFKRVFPLPSAIENAPTSLLSASERRLASRVHNSRMEAMHIYEHSATQENIRDTAFGLWQAIIEYTDHNIRGPRTNKKVITAGTKALVGRTDGIKVRALELLNVG